MEVKLVQTIVLDDNERKIIDSSIDIVHKVVSNINDVETTEVLPVLMMERCDIEMLKELHTYLETLIKDTYKEEIPIKIGKS